MVDTESKEVDGTVAAVVEVEPLAAELAEEDAITVNKDVTFEEEVDTDDMEVGRDALHVISLWM